MSGFQDFGFDWKRRAAVGDLWPPETKDWSSMWSDQTEEWRVSTRSEGFTRIHSRNCVRWFGDETCQSKVGPPRWTQIKWKLDSWLRSNVLKKAQGIWDRDLAQLDFGIFSKFEMGLEGNRFDIEEDIKPNATSELRKIPEEDLYRCFHQWQVQLCVFWRSLSWKHYEVNRYLQV